MNPDNDRKYLRIPKMAVLLIVIPAVGLLGWQLGRSKDPPANNQPANTQTDNPTAQPKSNSGAGDVKTLVNYTLPFNWGEASCPAEARSVFIIPTGGSEADCDGPDPVSNPISPVKISVDSANNKDCNQLQNVQNVSKHICISEYINGHKSLKAETVYNRSSSYNRDTTVNAYYIDIGKAVIKVEYFHSPNDHEHQNGFEQLAKSIQVKS